MREKENILDLIRLSPENIGFIFYPKSPRFVGEDFDVEITASVPPEITRTGVFVNSPTNYIMEKISRYGLHAVQLHGSEKPGQCEELSSAGVVVIKAFSVDDRTDFNMTDEYYGSCDYFLFDTKTNSPGGSGKKFDWNVLKGYTGETPFFLSGGIQPGDEQQIARIIGLPLYAIDINSRFEMAPGMKNIELISTFIDNIRKNKYGL
ncbi:MAG: phosphoribosylanthranilate isomerase [Bacteroidales bacterium]|nr:phosphoribosylanthranilate isomerase [Bacteroidales bacterium]